MSDLPPRPPEVAAPVLLDPMPMLRDEVPWAKPMRLSGVLERERFHPLLTALLTFVIGFVVFQVVGAIAMLAGALAGIEGPIGREAVIAALAEVQGDTVTILGGNAIGQLAGFCAFVLFVTWLHTPDVASFLRVRRPDAPQFGLAGVGLLAVLPFVTWIGQVNASIPLPEILQDLDDFQAALLEQVLGGELNVFYALVVAALTPAICEELMFRGYLQRQVERRLGVMWSIVLVGVFFGLFHLRPTQVLPLATLGLYLGFSVWVTGSLWTGVLVHLLNNGLAVIVSDYLKRQPDLDPVALESIVVPWYLALLSVLAVMGIAVLLLRRRDLLVRST